MKPYNTGQPALSVGKQSNEWESVTSKCHLPMNAVRILLVFILFTCNGCYTVKHIQASQKCSDYEQADGREITNGRIYEDKLLGQCIRIFGEVANSHSAYWSNSPLFTFHYMVLNLRVPRGMSFLPIYFHKEHDKILSELKVGDEVEVYGRVITDRENSYNNNLALNATQIKIKNNIIPTRVLNFGF
jgi:hypothetical protein